MFLSKGEFPSASTRLLSLGGLGNNFFGSSGEPGSTPTGLNFFGSLPPAGVAFGLALSMQLWHLDTVFFS